MSMRLSSRASSSSLVNTPLPPISDKGSDFTSPVVLITSIWISRPGFRSIRRAFACSACQSARREPREPMIKRGDIRALLLEFENILFGRKRIGVGAFVELAHLIEDRV